MHGAASLWGLLAAVAGTTLALLVYGVGLLDAERTTRFFGPVRSASC